MRIENSLKICYNITMQKMTCKNVIITGAYGGMGREVCKLLASNGYRVFALDKIVKEPEENVIPIEVDVTDIKSVQSAFNYVNSVVSEVFAIIHFAGVYMLNSLVEMSEEDFDKILKINLYGAFYVNKTFLPLLKKGSKIVMTTSELAPLDPLPFTGIYAVTKSALDRYAYSLKMELQLLDISVSVLRAGAVKTNMLGVSTNALDRFCENTSNYHCNAERFKKIVNGVEAKNISPIKIAEKTKKIIESKNPKFAYSINRNKLLLLLNALPSSLQFFIIKKILK